MTPQREKGKFDPASNGGGESWWWCFHLESVWSRIAALLGMAKLSRSLWLNVSCNRHRGYESHRMRRDRKRELMWKYWKLLFIYTYERPTIVIQWKNRYITEITKRLKGHHLKNTQTNEVRWWLRIMFIKKQIKVKINNRRSPIKFEKEWVADLNNSNDITI